MTEAAAEYVKIESLVPWAKNPRKNDPAVKEVAESIRRFGFGAPIIARRADGSVIAGHTRLKAAKLLGLETVPVRYLDLSQGEAEALALADNRLGELAEWDDAGLRSVLEGLQEQEVDLSGLGWSEEDLEGLLRDPLEAEEGHSIYTAKVESPIYVPSGDCPAEADLYDTGKTNGLIDRIMGADLPEPVRAFLLHAAGRHTVFRYDRIAEFYAHAPHETQGLMEESALVIIDFKKAIELGFVRLSAELAEAYTADHQEPR